MAKKKAKKNKQRGRFPWLLLVVLLAIGALFYDSNTRIVVSEYELSYDTLPESFDGFRIVALSDIHAAMFGKDNERLVAKVRVAKPDIIAITGDFTDGSDKLPLDEQLAVAEALVEKLVRIAPVYYITGNHEWDDGGIWELLSILEDHGVTILRNRYTLLESAGDAIILAGVDDPNGPADMISRGDFVESIYEREGDGFVIMLEHRNNNLPLYSSLGVELVLCGHAHGGIIRIPFTDGLMGPDRQWFPTYTNGIYTMDGTNMLVSRGVGNHTGLPRLLNNPHIVVAILRGES